MAADWYCEIDGITHGPMTAEQLKQLASDGKLQPAHPVWKEGMQKTVPARSVKGLFVDDGAVATATALAEVAKKPSAHATQAPTAKKDEELIEFEMIEEFEEVEVLEAVEEVEVVEVEPEPPKKGKKEKKEQEKEEEGPPPEVLAEIEATYREGLPDLDGGIVGKLCVETTGLRFLFEEEGEEEDYPISFKKIETVMEPSKGDFPKSMKRKALAQSLGGKAGKLAAGLLGKWMGGDAGKLVGKVGGVAGDAASKGADLGKPPRNRITVIAQLRKQRCKIYFDVHGKGKDGFEMTEEAKLFYKKIQKARDKFTRTESTLTESQGETNINVVVNQVAVEAPEREAAPKQTVGQRATASLLGGAVAGGLTGASPTAGKPFRVMSGGSIRGPFSLEELRGLVNSGNLGHDDLIGVETWLPLSTIGGLVGGGGGGARSASGAAQDEDEEVEVFEGDFEEVEDEDDPDAKEHVPAHKNEEASIPVDDEFQIG
jgi:hypothetical protein